jgi:hypothetical protein
MVFHTSIPNRKFFNNHSINLLALTSIFSMILVLFEMISLGMGLIIYMDEFLFWICIMSLCPFSFPYSITGVMRAIGYLTSILFSFCYFCITYCLCFSLSMIWLRKSGVVRTSSSSSSNSLSNLLSSLVSN